MEHELLVLDNASDDGSAEAVRERHPDARLFALDRRTGKADNDSLLLREARGRYCLLLNEDSELRDGAVRALLDALEADPRAAVAGAQLLDSDELPVPCAWRLPDIPWALASAVFMHDRVAVESSGAGVREVGWVQSSAALVRREAAEQVGWLDPAFFVYSDETDFCKRLHDAGWRILFVPAARAVHHNQLGTDAAAMSPADRRVPPQPRPLLPQARAAAPPARLEGVLDVGLPRARRGRRVAARARSAPLPAPRPPGAVPAPRRGDPRRRRGPQPCSGQ